MPGYSRDFSLHTKLKNIGIKNSKNWTLYWKLVDNKIHRSLNMKVFVKLIVIVVFVSLLSCPLWAASSDSHDVTVTISAINEVAVSGNITMTVNAAVPGQPPTAVQNALSTLDYTTNSATAKKITAGYSVTGGATGITLEATAASASGTSAGKVALGTVAVSVITGLTQCSDPAQVLTYDVTATEAATVGDHVFTVTYTMVDE
jgi:hypothetical protein